jgi:hypothetical protein
MAYAITGAAAGCYVPDVGERFMVTETWEWRRWQLTPFPWYRKHVHIEESTYRVTSWLRRRQPRPEPQDERSQMVREILDGMIADGLIEGPRGAGPDRVPLEWCHREEAEYVEGAGVAGTIERVQDLRLIGQVSWPERLIASERALAEERAGKPLI